ncbi:hypothetical protein M634_03115 [Vibrio parahaemolyticus O1:Kuk str. FDA_R31]|uniref:glycosyltransferase family 2 protein n=1 Tax=Vibrio parahaemolyticus TaxID=670 RepID=UPI0003591E97|nr:glycosyltransferase family 2 protein [Vibrio parahaemolyticus]AGQ91931.1 hypothetical protein M634_03115 [Vibrio parahaemolyticus O1:Kuk str. FDA_R31]EIK4806897.1 glycosyltransferase family 2 protein [Vibrio parahaemolyticus]EJB0395952.1 glycosyltransferase family 2 protein [Vibrio parahaemolyticus]EJB5287758.1 glycosyltransferase family 2 protein [Vibrio parahaemolyticus]EJG0722274.1 glycosyltransferase family 2 protein [Vibrio parahaemolyticus]
MIIIPMAGMSSRFFKAGYDKPKYMLEAHGKTLFEHSVESFEALFLDTKFLFIVKDVYNTKNFVYQKAKALGIKDFNIVILAENTRGQAETVIYGLEGLKSQGISYDGPITIFNIDTFRPNFFFPRDIEKNDGYLEVFEGEGDNWSFVKPESEKKTIVKETAEKRKISNLCCTGLYHFGSVSLYVKAYNNYLTIPKENWDSGELYVAPIYNYLIKQGYKIHYNKINRDEVIFCGVPEEYLEYLDK